MAFSTSKVFQIREWVEFDSKGRANCPCCSKGPKDKTLSLVPNSEYGYKCFRGCTPAEIREALGAPPPGRGLFGSPPNRGRLAHTVPPPPPTDYTVDEDYVNRAVKRLLNENSRTAAQARNWLEQRGIDKTDIARLRLGLGKRVIIPDQDKPDKKETYGAICIFIPIPAKPGRYYVKKRVAPWLKGEERPDYLGRWSQFGVPATIWFTHFREDASQTWFCEGEWDAIRLAQLARTHRSRELIAVACSTAGCGSVPPAEELARLPGTVKIFYDRNDLPSANGTRPGDEGALKLALALGSRGQIASVPMPDDCSVNGWDVSNALDAGYGWSDFQQSAAKATTVTLKENSANGGIGSGGSGGNGRCRGSGSSGDGGDGGEGNETNGKVVSHPAFTPLNGAQLLGEINALIAQDLPASQVATIIPELANRSAYSERSVWKIYSDREAEIEIEEERAQTAAMIDALLIAKEAAIDLHSVLPIALAEPLLKFATWLQVRPESTLAILLTTVSALHHTQTTSWLNRDWDFSVKPNLYSAIVAPASQKKSPIVKALARKPLKVLEKKARQKWLEQQRQYLELELLYQSLDKQERSQQFPEGLPSPPPDRRKVYSFTKNTSEGLRNQVGAYPDQGLLAIPDELAGLLKSANAYRGGRGSDEEDLLSYYDGMGETVLRASGLAGDFDNLLLSILGTIQPKVLQGFLSEGEDINGRWARFMFVNQPLVPSMMKADGGSFDLTPLLASLYEKVNQLPPMEYLPDPEAFKYYCGVYNELERRRVADPSSAMSAVWGKAEGRIGKIATNLHVIHSLIAGRTPSVLIPKARYVEATSITLFFIQQVFSLYNELGEADALATHLVKVINLSQKKKRWITARDVQLCYDQKYRPRPNEVRSWFRELEAMGFGVTQGEGRYLKYNYQIVGAVGEEVEDSPTAPSIDLSSFKPNVEFVGECGVFLSKNSQLNGQSQSGEAASNLVQIAPTTPTNSTNGGKLEPLGNPVVGSHSTFSPTTPTNLVEPNCTELPLTPEIDDRPFPDDDPPGGSPSPNLPKDSPDDSGIGMKSESVQREERASSVVVDDTDAGGVEIDASSPLAELQQLLLICETVADLVEVKGMYPTQQVKLAYKSLNSYERKPLRKIILREAEPIRVNGKAISPCQFLSSFAGQQKDNILVGDKVYWSECPGHLESWSPFEVLEVRDDGWAKLDILTEPVPLCELVISDQ